MSDNLDIHNLRAQLIEDLQKSTTLVELQDVQSKYLGKDSSLQNRLKQLAQLSPEEKQKIGAEVNKAKQEFTDLIEKKRSQLKKTELEARLAAETLDLDLPPLPASRANLHPITTELERIVDIFARMGFKVYEPFMVDDDQNTFTTLNVPAGHPARDMWDTIHLEDGNLLITHTSAMQNRILSGNQPPIRAIAPGKCFRNEATDSTHEHSFFQLEGVYLDKNIKLTDLIGTLKEFLNQYFETEVPIKIQPTFFPFVEPGMEVMMPKPKLGGKLDLTNFNPETADWLEVIPCGPIHPNVITAAGLDPHTYSGFAWGLGLERLIMIKRQISDLRYFHSGRIDFLQQF